MRKLRIQYNGSYDFTTTHTSSSCRIVSVIVVVVVENMAIEVALIVVVIVVFVAVVDFTIKSTGSNHAADWCLWLTSET